MNCHYHPDQEATAGCAVCARAMCAACNHLVGQENICPDCLGRSIQYLRHVETPAYKSSDPNRAALLGLVPALGAIYNGTYLRAIYQFAIFALLWLIAEAGDMGFLGFLMVLVFYIYTIVDAYRTASRIQQGVLGTGRAEATPQALRAPLLHGLVLIVLGIIFILNNFDLFPMEILGKLWPLVLVAGGGYLIWKRRSGIVLPAADAPRSPVIPPVPPAPVDGQRS